eukprot:6982654-Pyramimonas_sp.AAC.1
MDEGALRAATLGRSNRSPVPLGRTTASVHGRGQNTVAGVPRQGVRKLAGAAPACDGRASCFGGTPGS